MVYFYPMLFVVLTVILSVTAQLLLKYRTSQLGQFGDDLAAAVWLYGTDIGVIVSIGLVFMASATWALAMRTLPVNQIYPWMSLNFIGVTAGSSLILGETIGDNVLIGVVLICSGLAVLRGNA